MKSCSWFRHPCVFELQPSVDLYCFKYQSLLNNIKLINLPVINLGADDDNK